VPTFRDLALCVNCPVPGSRTTRKEKDDAFDWRIVRIEQESLRESAAGECTNAKARLERARLQWHHFERKDKPAFVRWRAREFGALLSKAREIETQIRDAQTLVHEVEMEMRRGFQDAHSAYQRVMFRRENPSIATGDEEADGPQEERGAATKLSDFEKESLFQDWVKRSLGTNPDKMDDEAYSTTFEAFKSHMFRGAPEEPRAQNVQRSRAQKRVEIEEEEAEEEEAKDARVKALYRVLVRRLHPDLRDDASTEVSGLWHEVQEAYAAGDVAHLEILLALIDIESNGTGAQTSVSQMRATLAELERATRALEKSLLEAEGKDAWDFAQSGATTDLRLRVERQLKSDLAQRSLRLDVFTKTIAAWAHGPIANRKVMTARGR
jgi:hypothetical protein